MENINDIWCIEIADEYSGRDYLEVVNTHRHHYTGEIMRYIRRDWVDPLTKESVTTYEYYNETEWEELVSKRISDEVPADGQM